LDTRGNNIVVDMPERLIGFDIEDQTAADNLWPPICQRQMIQAGITSAHFVKLAWRLAIEKARELGWIV
jgi:hypothetical protein